MKRKTEQLTYNITHTGLAALLANLLAGCGSSSNDSKAALSALEEKVDDILTPPATAPDNTTNADGGDSGDSGDSGGSGGSGGSADNTNNDSTDNNASESDSQFDYGETLLYSMPAAIIMKGDSTSQTSDNKINGTIATIDNNHVSFFTDDGTLFRLQGDFTKSAKAQDVQTIADTVGTVSSIAAYPASSLQSIIYKTNTPMEIQSMLAQILQSPTMKTTSSILA